MSGSLETKKIKGSAHGPLHQSLTLDINSLREQLSLSPNSLATNNLKKALLMDLSNNNSTVNLRSEIERVAK